MDAVRFGISVTQTAYGDLANILVMVSFVSLVETTLAVAQPRSHSRGESSRCPKVAGDLRPEPAGLPPWRRAFWGPWGLTGHAGVSWVPPGSHPLFSGTGIGATD